MGAAWTGWTDCTMMYTIMCNMCTFIIIINTDESIKRKKGLPDYWITVNNEQIKK